MIIDYAIGCEAFMEVNIGHDRLRLVKIGENSWKQAVAELCQAQV